MSPRAWISALVAAAVLYGAIALAVAALAQQPPAEPPAWSAALPSHGDLVQQNGGRDPFAGMMSPGNIGCCHGDCEAVAVSQSPDGSQWLWIRSAMTGASSSRRR